MWASVQPVHTTQGRWLTGQSWDTVCLVTTPVPLALEHRLEIASLVLQDTCISFNSVSPAVPQGTKLAIVWKMFTLTLNITSVNRMLALLSTLNPQIQRNTEYVLWNFLSNRETCSEKIFKILDSQILQIVVLSAKSILVKILVMSWDFFFF